MKIELNEPTLPKGAELYVVGLGTLKNGKEVEFSDEQIAAFEAQQGRTTAEAFASNENIKLSGPGSRTTGTVDEKEGGE